VHHYSAIARLAAAVVLRNHPSPDSRRELTRPAREAFWGRWLHDVDPGGELNAVERVSRAREARRLYYVELGKRGRGIPKRARQKVTP